MPCLHNYHSTWFLKQFVQILLTFYSAQFTIFMGPKNFPRHFSLTCSSHSNSICFYFCQDGVPVKSFYSLHDPTLLEQSCTTSASFGTGVTFCTVYYCLLFSCVPLHYDRTYIMKHFVSLTLTLILSAQLHNIHTD